MSSQPWTGDTRVWTDDEVAYRLAIADAIAEAIADGTLAEIAPGVYQRSDDSIDEDGFR